MSSSDNLPLRNTVEAGSVVMQQTRKFGRSSQRGLGCDLRAKEQSLEEAIAQLSAK